MPLRSSSARIAGLALCLSVGCASVPDRRTPAEDPVAPDVAPAPDAPRGPEILTPPPRPSEAPPFQATIAPLPDAMREAMVGASWQPGCPVGLEALRIVTMPHWDMEGRVAEGQLIVAAHVAEDVRDAFAAAYAERFPIERMEPVHLYGGDDDRSMAANNTSAFNCRPVAGTSRWSQHSYGTAMDVNPVQNPYVRGERVDPPAGRAYLDRDDVRPGMLLADSALVRVLRERGWGWGGEWAAIKDYQHLSESGR